MASVETSSSRPFHIVIFGASGFTGQYVVEEVARTACEGPGGTLRWAVAGRSQSKLEKYRFFGEPVVKACVENGAHCLDISGEPQATSIHDATWESAIYGFTDRAHLQSLRRKFNYKPLPVVGAKIKRRGTLFFSSELQQYTMPFMGSDPSVVKRTQRFLVEQHQESPVQYGAYAGVGGVGNIIKMLVAVVMFLFLIKFSFGRNLLIKVVRCTVHGMESGVSCLFLTAP
ncbi:hypothetical protein CRUP_021034 [Coryphaenoides rupestris]|nr:hypothetical protein CRUP_021034 [Coryphaenoides rupestris]